jgi:hypothetical protein
LAIPPPARVFVAVECNFELPLPKLNCTRKLHCREILQSFGLEEMMMLTLDSVAANSLSFLWHTVMQSWLQISSFKPCFASNTAYTLLSNGTLSCNPSFRFDLQTLFCFCCCTCTFFLMAHCHAILASDSSFKPCFDSVAANALLLCHFVMQSWLQISSFKPCFSSVAANALSFLWHFVMQS